MKYNDRASKQFQQRSLNTKNQKRRIKRSQQFNYEIRTQLNHPLCRVMTNKQKVDFYEEFEWGTNGRWNTMTKNYPDFEGSFTEFIEYLKDNGDERITQLMVKLREINIHKIIG